jgi:tyrosine-protein kinase
MTLSDLTAALRRFKWLALFLFVLISSIGLAAAFLPADRYESRVVVLAQFSGKSGVVYGPAEAAQVLTPPLIARVESESFANAVEIRLPRRTENADLKFVADSDPGTAVVQIKSTATDRDVVRPAAEAAVAQLEADPVSDLLKISAVNPATLPESLAAKRDIPIVLGSIILGAIVAVFAALAAHMIRRRLTGSALVREKFGLRVLAEIPSQGSIPTTEDLFNTGWPPEVLEGYQRLLANFEILAPEPLVVAVVSWDAEEGKTTVTANLAWALATMNRRVLAIDCDLRHPELDLALNVSLNPGVADVAGATLPRTVRQRTMLPTLQVIAAGEVQGHPAAPMAKALPELLADGRKTETVLIDTAPMLAAETTFIMSQVDAVVLVIDMKRRSPSELEEMLEDLALIDANVLGVVLNRATRVEGRRSSRYYYRGGAVGEAGAGAGAGAGKAKAGRRGARSKPPRPS